MKSIITTGCYNENMSFSLEMEVRDYECDLQGIVNNAVYLNYLEHCRHKYLQSIGIDFARWHQEGKILILARLEIEYKLSLKSGDSFAIKLTPTVQPATILFDQHIFLPNREKPIAKAKATCACIINGKIKLPKELIDAIERRG